MSSSIVNDADQLGGLAANFVAEISFVGGAPDDGNFDSAEVEDGGSSSSFDSGSDSSSPRYVPPEDEANENKPAPLALDLKFVDGHFLEKNGKFAQ